VSIIRVYSISYIRFPTSIEPAPPTARHQMRTSRNVLAKRSVLQQRQLAAFQDMAEAAANDCCWATAEGPVLSATVRYLPFGATTQLRPFRIPFACPTSAIRSSELTTCAGARASPEKTRNGTFPPFLPQGLNSNFRQKLVFATLAVRPHRNARSSEHRRCR